MKDFKNKNIAVVGGGVEGLSSAKFLKKRNAKVVILDKKNGENYLDNLRQYDLIVRSPGVHAQTIKDALDKTAKDGLNSKEKFPEITSQTNLFMELSPAKIIGVTGTKGKGTTSSLIYKMLKKQGFDAYLGGNIGLPPFEFLDNLNTHSIVVLEMSSFQLLDATKSPNIAVMLMTTSEHLNWHKSMEEYINAKRNILKHQSEKDFAIINKDYLESRESDIETNGKIFYVSTEDECAKGSFILQKSLWIRDGEIEERVLDTDEILIPGAHNLENSVAASMAAYLAGVSIANIANVLKNFKGLEHRLELVAEINGIKYYDDSFSTTPESAIAAIKAFKNPEILILGGSSKNSNFKDLGELISSIKNIKAIIGIGDEWTRIRENIHNLSPDVLVLEGAKDMETIVAAASKLAVEGDVIILSPACASFGMFKNYKDRGDQFKRQVEKIKTT